MIYGWEETIWSIEVMSPGLVSQGLLIDPPECLPLVLHGLLWDFPNKQATQWGIFMILLSLLGITPLLDSLRIYLKGKCFRLWCQTRSSLSSHPKRSLVDHILAISSLRISYPIKYFSTSSKLVVIWDGILFVVRRSFPASSLLSWLKIWIFKVSP